MRSSNWPRYFVPATMDAISSAMTLLSNSPNIDRGVVIPGVNGQFMGSAPDLGAYESAYGTPPVVTPVVTNTPLPVPTETPTPSPSLVPVVTSISRFFLAFVGIAYIGLGIWCAVAPEKTSKAVGFALQPGQGQSEFLTVYGGLEVALGLLFVCRTSGRRDRARPEQYQSGDEEDE